MEYIEQYLIAVKKLSRLQNKLVDVLNPLVSIQPAQLGDYAFKPTANTIAEQIKNWPRASLVFPLHSWVQPNRGEIVVGEEKWVFSFTGQGISFISLHTSARVIVEYSIDGKICITEWAVFCYLQSAPMVGEMKAELLAAHKELFNWMIEHQFLTRMATKPEFPETVFLLSAS